jgi:YVTN family beta-propeller protein
MVTIRSVPGGGYYQSWISGDNNYLYVVNTNSGTITFIDQNTRTVVHTISTNLSVPMCVVSDGTYIYVTNANANTVSQFNISTKAFVKYFNVGSNPQGMTYDGANVWVANYLSQSISKINIIANTVTTYTGFTNPYGLTNDSTYIYVADNGLKLSRVLISSGAILWTVSTVGNPSNVCVDNNYIWLVCQANAMFVHQYNIPLLASTPPTLIKSYPMNTNPHTIASDNTNVWVGYKDNNSTSISQINISSQTTSTISGTIQMPSPLCVYISNYYVWVTNRDNAQISYFVNPNPVSCYNEGSLILTLKNNIETYLPIETLNIGDLVKSYEIIDDNYIEDYKPILLIGKKIMVNDPARDDGMFILEKTENNDVFKDLIITGGHLIKFDSTIDNEADSVLLNGISMISANKSNMCVKLENYDNYTYYHLVLKNEIDKHFCINANGILSESTITEHFLKNNFI